MEWRPVPDYPAYEISEHGDLRRIRTIKRLRGFIDADGYVRYCIRGEEGTKNARPAHQLVARAFIGSPPSERHEVAHNDGSRLHNHYSNLRWALPASNHADKVTHDTSPKGTRNPRVKLSEADVKALRIEYRKAKVRGSGLKLADLDTRYRICRGQIIRIATGEAWRHLPMPTEHELQAAGL